MSLTKKIVILLMFMTTLYVGYQQILPPQEKTAYISYQTSQIQLDDAYTLFHENNNFKYYYKKHNGILMIEDKRNHYIWKSGIDHDYDQYIEKTVELYRENNPDADESSIAMIAGPLEAQMNNTREGIANSLIVVDMLRESDPARTATQMGSSFKTFNIRRNLADELEVQEDSKTSVNTNNLYQVVNEDNHFVLDYQFKAFEVQIKVHIVTNENGFEIEIKDHEITGGDSNMINYINIMPFMGAYGGKQTLYNTESGKWDIEVLKERKQGYVFVPDGPGALIEYSDYASSLSGYTGLVYGNDLAQQSSNKTVVSASVPLKNPLMPLFGIALEEKAAFLAYAKKGEPYMQILSRPNDSSDSYNLTNYTISFPRFMFNKSYSQVYNQAGDTYIDSFNERNHYDINMQYHFLASEPNYIGMAKAYKNYLLNESILHMLEMPTEIDIPIRIDFLMSDAKKALIGTEDVVVTKIDDVNRILLELQADNILNINTGLLGYQKGGLTLGSKSKFLAHTDIGSKNEFSAVIEQMNLLGIDISLHVDYAKITSEAISLTNNAAKHYNGIYLSQANPNGLTALTDTFYYTRPKRIVEFLLSHEKAVRTMSVSSITNEGFTNLLYGDYGSKGNDVMESIEMYQAALNQLQDTYMINNVTPNQYLWQTTDRFLQTPMFSSQYIVQTKTVPFLQIVLNGTMELYTTYVNFSFYEQKDILKMIDYNTFPAFILTNEPAYLLQKTNAQNFFSTEYDINKSLILDVYEKVNDALKHVRGSDWIDRIELSNHVILNRYQNGITIIINYSNQPFMHEGQWIEALDFLVIGA